MSLQYLFLYGLHCLSFVLITVFFINRPGGNPEVEDVNLRPVETQQSTMHHQAVKQLQAKLETLRGGKSILLKRLKEQHRRLPIIEQVKKLKLEFGHNIRDKVSERRSILQTLQTMNNIKEENDDLTKKVHLARYEQLVTITLWVDLKNFMTLLDDLKFKTKAESLEDTSINMRAEADFLEEHVETLENLRESYAEEIEELDKQLSNIKNGTLSTKEKLEELRGQYNLAEMMKQVDELKRAVAEKESETDTYYKEYLNNYNTSIDCYYDEIVQH